MTRWDSRWGAIDAIINNFSAVIKALVDISEEGSGSRSVNGASSIRRRSIRRNQFVANNSSYDQFVA